GGGGAPARGGGPARSARFRDGARGRGEDRVPADARRRVDVPATPAPVVSGRRVTRGLFRASAGGCLKADSTGAYTSRRKGVADAVGNGIAGMVVHPVRMTLANGPHGSHVHIA